MTTETLVVVMPRLSDSMEEGTVVRWLKANGDTVDAGEELVEIETDKATMTYEAESSGVLHRLVEEGDTVDLGAPLAELMPEGAEPEPRSEEAPVIITEARPSGEGTPTNGRSSGDGRAAADGRVPASPVARRVAGDAGVDLQTLLPGSGPRGRVVKRDVESAIAAAATATVTPAAAAPAAPSPPAPRAPAPAPAAPGPDAGASPAASGKGAVEVDDLSRLQAIVSRRMSESRATVPDFSVEVDVDADALVALRKDLRSRLPEGPVPSYNDFIVKACAQALRAHPRVNGAYRDGAIERYGRVNVGVAVAADGALLVPVVTDADIKSVGTIATETRRLAERARAGSSTPPELSSGTFTVSNLGMFGVTRFTAVVNMPQAAILAVGALEQRAVVREGALRVGQVMTLTLCSDHRILFGADAAAFLADIRAGLEEPMRLLV
jgi:pyruvate dehydrogenase E2 component (dihydrolipoamide acetyltransferase)